MRRRLRPAAALVVLAACSSGGGGAALGGAPSTARTATTTAPATTAPEPTVPAPAAAATCPATPARATPDPNRPRYKLTVDVNLDQSVVTGMTDVRFIPDLPTDRLILRLWPNGPRPAQGGGSMDTGDVTVDGRSAPAARDDPTTLDVRPGGTFAAGQPVDVHVPWTLHLPTASRDRISRDGDSVRLGSFFPILPWEPGSGWKTEPPTGAFAEASTAPTADFDATVTVPDGFAALASGTNDRPNHWTAIAMRDFALSVSRFTVATGTAMAPNPVEVKVGVANGINESPEAYLNRVKAVLADFGQRFGPYPWPTFTLAITPNVGGGIEYPSHVMQSPGTLGETTSHELAHQWFYGLVGDDQGRDPWLDEGLASWGEARHEDTLPVFTSRTMPADAAGQLGKPMTYWANFQADYYVGVYVQGVQALAALGPPDLVDCALRTYVAVNAYRIATPKDLVASMRAAFPDAGAVLAKYGVSAG